MATKAKKAKKDPIPETHGVPADVQAVLDNPHTLEALRDGYIAHLEQVGKASGTVFSYRMELDLAIKELGAETTLDLLTAEWITRFFECERVTRSKTGRPKSKLTIDKTRRVLRLALDWAVSERWIERSPVPAANPGTISTAA